jgi:hypothetical protein
MYCQIDKNVLQWKNLDKSRERKFCKTWTDIISMNIPTFFHCAEIGCYAHCTDAKTIKQMIDPYNFEALTNQKLQFV